MSLVYTDFRTASYRNLNACTELLNNLNIYDENKKKQILHKVYYLSGYIIEFCYKFALFSHLRSDLNNILTQTTNLNEYRKEEKFPKKWQVHSFGILNQLCTENQLIFSKDIPFLGCKSTNKDINKLEARWNTEIRYALTLSNQPVTLEEDIMRLFIDEIAKMLYEVTQKYK